jgi:hypothetical protein
MGLMDKVKQGAGQAMAKAQQGVSQGKAKLDEAQSKRQWDALLRNLGAAVYAQERQGGPAEAIATALAALDEHAAAHGAGATNPVTSDGGDVAPAAEAGAPAPGAGGTATTSGDFSINDL